VTTFIIVAVLGVVILLGSLVLDGVFDALDLDFLGSGIFSGASIGGFISGTGLGGIIGTSLGWPPILALVLGLAVGSVIGYLAVFAYRLLKNSEDPQAAFALDQLTGTTAVVTGVAGEGYQALVRATYLGSPRTFSAVSVQQLLVGQQVYITEVLNPDTVRVAVVGELPRYA
jgi:hypothetical protein